MRFLKRTLAAFMCCVLLSGCIGFADAVSAIPGDMDGDGVVTTSDARLALRIAAKLQAPTELQRVAGDLDGDGELSTSEARQILRVAAHLDTLPDVILPTGKEEILGYYQDICEKAQAEKPGYSAKTEAELLNISQEGSMPSMIGILRSVIQQMLNENNEKDPQIIAKGSDASAQGLPTAQGSEVSLLSKAACNQNGTDTVVTLTLNDFANPTPGIIGLNPLYGLFTQEALEDSLQESGLGEANLEEVSLWHTNSVVKCVVNDSLTMNALWASMDCQMHLKGSYSEISFDITATFRVTARCSDFVW